MFKVFGRCAADERVQNVIYAHCHLVITVQCDFLLQERVFGPGLGMSGRACGRTALHMATGKKMANTVERLLALGANAALLDNVRS